MMRNNRRWILALCLLVSASARAERSGGVLTPVRGLLPGLILLDPSPDETSYLCVPRAVLDELLCDAPNTGGTEEVHLVIRRPSSNLRPFEVEARLFAAPGEPTLEGFSTSLPEMGGEHVSQGCGAWKFRYDIPPAGFTKQAEVRLLPTALDSGTFSMEVFANARIVFEELSTGREVVLPHPFIAAYNGYYALVPAAQAGPLQAAGISNLLLFSQRQGGAYCPRHGCAVEGLCGWVCLEPPQSVFELVNPTGSQCGPGATPVDVP